MPESPPLLPLADDFPAASDSQWRDAVAAVLGKRTPVSPDDAVAKLSRTTYDDITVAPLYTAADVVSLADAGAPGQAPFVRGARSTSTGWDIRTRHDNADAGVAAQEIVQDLETGATSIWLVVGDGALSVDDLPVALKDVYLDLAPIVLDAGEQTVAALDAVLALAAERDIAPAELRGSAGVDPIGRRARTGARADLSVLANVAERLAQFPQMQVATVDATVYNSAGATDAQEIGIATAVGVAYLRALVDAGLSVDDALRRLEFRFAVTDEQFAQIAKLRAARRIWSRVAELSGADAGPAAGAQRQHAVTSEAMLTQRDPWVNLLRTTIACFAGAVGGAQATTVLPFDTAVGRSDDFARRLARNTQSILHDESSLARVLDPGGGSWYVESLTEALAEAAWTVFTDIEKNGGALARLDDGSMARFLDRVRERRDEDIAHRRSPITGVSEFALITEEPLRRDSRAEQPADGLLPAHRYAERFEAFRDRADAAPTRPQAYLATLGPYAAHNARAGFAANLLQAGGIECVRGGVDEFAASGLPVAVLCSSDELYAEQGATAAADLRAAGAKHVWLAGKTDVDGVDGQLFAGVDAIGVLAAIFEQLGVQ